MKRAKRTLVRFAVPDIALVRDDGQSVALADVLDEGRPVAVNFIFTTCTTICPRITSYNVCYTKLLRTSNPSLTSLSLRSVR